MASASGTIRHVDVTELPGALTEELHLADRRPRPRLVVVHLEHLGPEAAVAPIPRTSGAVLVGLSTRRLPAYAERLCSNLALTLVPEADEDPGSPWQVGVPDVDLALRILADAVERFPATAHALIGLLRLTGRGPVADALVAESLAYSMLMAGEEHHRWLAGRTRRPVPPSEAPVVLERDGRAERRAEQTGAAQCVRPRGA